jgi:DNA-binding response OmpR family regulator
MSQSLINWETISILVVEDEEELRNILCMFFKRRKAKVFSASNGEIAFEIVNREKIDVVLSDVRMPGTDGIWLLNKLRERGLERRGSESTRCG